MKRKLLIPALATAFTAALLVGQATASARIESSSSPIYDANGNLRPPANYRDWIFLSSGFDMSYTAAPPGAGGENSRFDNVFANPESYRGFLRTGAWPDKTMLVLEVRAARSRGSINLRGNYQSTGLEAVEVHVKDTSRFPSGWAFFRFESLNATGKLIPEQASCSACHQAHGAVDTTFVQFYPTLLPVAQEKGTLSRSYLKEQAENRDGKSRR